MKKRDDFWNIYITLFAKNYLHKDEREVRGKQLISISAPTNIFHFCVGECVIAGHGIACIEELLLKVN